MCEYFSEQITEKQKKKKKPKIISPIIYLGDLFIFIRILNNSCQMCLTEILLVFKSLTGDLWYPTFKSHLCGFLSHEIREICIIKREKSLEVWIFLSMSCPNSTAEIKNTSGIPQP